MKPGRTIASPNTSTPTAAESLVAYVMTHQSPFRLEACMTAHETQQSCPFSITEDSRSPAGRLNHQSVYHLPALFPTVEQTQILAPPSAGGLLSLPE